MRVWLAAMVLAGGSLVVPSSARAGADGPAWVPASWRVGGTVGGEEVTAFQAHAEFVRVTTQAHAFEIVRCMDSILDPWCKAGARIQPAPGAAADEDWLRARLAEVVALRADAAAAEWSEVVSTLAPPCGVVGAEPPADERAQAARTHATLQAATLRILALLLAALLAWRLAGADRHRRALVLAAVALAVALPVLGRTVVGADSLEVQQVDLLHEGWQHRCVEQLTAPWPSASPPALLLGAGSGLPGRAVANLLLQSLVCVLLFGVLTFAGVAARRGLALTALAAFAPMNWHAMHSETEIVEGQVLWLLGAVGVVAASRDAWPRLWRVLGLVLLGLLATFVGRRSELLGAAAIGAAVGGWTLLVAPPTRARITAAAVAAGGTLLRRAPWPVWVVVVVLPSIVWLPSDLPLPATALYGAWPLRLQALRLPLDLAHGAPLLLTIVAVAGVLAVVRRGHNVAPRWLVAMTLGQYCAYVVVGHGDVFELQRYCALLLPALAWIGADGWRWLDDATATWRAASPARRNVWLAALLLLALADGRLGDRDGALDDWGTRRPLQRNPQVEARFLHQRLAAEPDCVFVTFGAVDADTNGWVTVHELLVFGATMGAPLRVSPTPDALHAALALLDPPPRCLRAYRGLDCALLGVPSCEELGRGPALSRFDAPSRPFRAGHFGRLATTELQFDVRDLAPPWRLEPGG